MSFPRSAIIALREFLKSAAAGGLILIMAAALALVLANSPAAPLYFSALKIHFGGLTVLHWINDALMALFFLVVGLEIKHEMIGGHLSTWPRRILPCVAASGGMIVPALIYLTINADSPATLRGWAIPAATDIAFALGVLTLLGRRVPVSLKVFLVALAIIDDLGAIAIIAVVYSNELSPLWLGLAAAAFALLLTLNRRGVVRLLPYLVIGVAMWFFVLRSGVHATLAGVALALTIPLETTLPQDEPSPLERLEHFLNPWVAFFIVPLFGFANAGVSLHDLSIAALTSPVPLGIAAGLLLGKQIGVFVSAWLTIRLGLADKPERASFAQLYGVSAICGVGFTMSLFIGLLAFPDSAELQEAVKVGVLSGSVLSMATGTVILLATGSRKNSEC